MQPHGCIIFVFAPGSAGVTLLLHTKENEVIARVWHGWTTPENADGYESLLKPDLLPGLSKAKGFLGSRLLRRNTGDEVEFITIILWDSLDSIRALAGQNYEIAVIPEERRKYLKRFDAKAVHYEVVSAREPER
jgi:heme-degrading monooxygenase HmoA